MPSSAPTGICASTTWEGTAEIQRLVVANHLPKRGYVDLVTLRVPLPVGISLQTTVTRLAM
jgi:hypothetical protein